MIRETEICASCFRAACGALPRMRDRLGETPQVCRRARVGFRWHFEDRHRSRQSRGHAPDKLRYDACLTVDDQFRAIGETGAQKTPRRLCNVAAAASPRSFPPSLMILASVTCRRSLGNILSFLSISVFMSIRDQPIHRLVFFGVLWPCAGQHRHVLGPPVLPAGQLFVRVHPFLRHPLGDRVVGGDFSGVTELAMHLFGPTSPLVRKYWKVGIGLRGLVGGRFASNLRYRTFPCGAGCRVGVRCTIGCVSQYTQA